MPNRPSKPSARLTLAAAALVLTSGNWARAQDSGQTFAIHGQSTFVEQVSAAFHAPYSGLQSLNPHGESRETWDVTVYAGVRPWKGAEIWINPEVDQGFGLSDTFGVAGFPNGEAYKVGKSSPYVRLQRLFIRQTIDLAGASTSADADLNQLAGVRTEDRLVLSAGKLSAIDIFDTNVYAHDPRGDFLNWTLIDTGSYDYAADAWAYTYGGAAELYVGRWAFRAGAFNLSTEPNSAKLESDFSQRQIDGEVEERHTLMGRPGAVRITGFVTQGRMGRFTDAIALAQHTGQPADIGAVRRYQSRPGVSLNLEQQVSNELGLFLRAGVADGNLEPFEFTDVDRTIAIGGALSGARWGRSGDVIGLAGVVNGVSRVHEQFLDAGGTGILVGDGRLPHPAPEEILETYYKLAVRKGVAISADYQFIDHPAYNRDRGPVSAFAVRVHGQF
jgi:high affinity Mn2+ porin